MLALVGVLAAGAGVQGFFYRQAGADIAKARLAGQGEAAKPPLIASATPQETPTAVPAPATSPVMQAQSEFAPARVSPPVSAGILKVLPDLTVPIKDWRSFRPHEITVTPRPDMPVSFEAVSIDQGAGRTTWIGRSDIDNATMVAIATRDSWTAVLAFPHGNEYTITVAGGNSVVVENNPDLEACGNGLAPARRADASGSTAGAAITSVTPPDATGRYPVDVLLLYDDATEQAAAATVAASGLGLTAESYIDSTTRARIESGNLALDQSGVNNLRWRCVGLFKIPAYENADNKMETDLDIIANTVGIAGQYALDKAVATGADQTILLVGGNRNYSGLALTPGHQAVVLWAASYITVAHELSHNFSCLHDRQTEAAKDGDGLFNYGYRFTDQQGRDTGTIMSYAGYRLPYFSSPDVVADGTALGIPGSQPKAADNARTLREHAAAMADFRMQMAVLEITQQPQPVTVTTGGLITFSVAATGGNLSYQWALGGTAISGATAATFSKDSATTGDAGSYTVTVSDANGSVQSAPVTATVNPVKSGNPSSNNSSNSSNNSISSGGGGGGGGAPSLWFYGALAMLIGVRRVFGRK